MKNNSESNPKQDDNDIYDLGLKISKDKQQGNTDALIEGYHSRNVEVCERTKIKGCTGDCPPS